MSLQTISVTKAWETEPDFEKLLRDSGIDVCEDGFRLFRGWLVADETGEIDPNWKYGAGWQLLEGGERIEGLVCAKKEFLLDDPACRGAVLMVFGPAAGFEVALNGRTLEEHFTPPQDYWDCGWSLLKLPPELLRAGLNDVVLRARPGEVFLMSMECSLHPNRSARSVDGGQTWDYDHLGQQGHYDGEYLVRLRLDRYAPAGQVTSPAVDLLALAADDPRIAVRGGVVDVSLEIDAETPPGTQILLEMRAGPTPSYDPARWTAWEPVSEGTATALAENARYCQWRATLKTTMPLATPIIRGLALKARVEREVGVTDNLQVAKWDNREIVRSSYHFAYQPPSARTEILRKLWKLDEVVASARNEFEKFTLLRQWVRQQWENGWDRGALDYVPPWDARLILTLASKENSLGMCTHYANTFVQCCAALGLTARTLIRGHCQTEVWSNDFGKWCLMDPGGDTDDSRKATGHYEKHGIPLNALNLHRAYLRAKASGELAALDGETPVPEVFAGCQLDSPWILGYQRFFIPLRNNHLDSQQPEESQHGSANFKFTRHLWWRDEETPPPLWTNKHTSRPADMYWTLNQAEFHLQRSDQSSALLVQLDTETPSFKAFLVRENDGGWHERPAEFLWHLRPGENILEARPVNQFGLDGITSRIVINSTSY